MTKYKTDSKFCGFCWGWGSTTGIDNHGDIIPIESQRRFQKQLEEIPKIRKVTFNHQEGNFIGEIVESNLIIEEKFAGVKIKVGIYEDKKSFLEMIESGEIKGFSVGAIVGDLSHKDIKESDFKIEIDGKIRSNVELFLKNNNIKYGAVLNKSAEALSIIAIAVGVLDIFITVSTHLHSLWLRNKDKKINIKYKDEEYNIDETFPEKLEKIKREGGFYSSVFNGERA